MAVEEARLIGDPDSRVTSLNTLGYIHWKLGAVEEFRQCFEEALQVARAAGDRSLEAQALGSLSNFYSHTGTSTRQSGFCSKC
jgi:tetratricopeptide (TPR) repeat protein